MAHWPHGVRQVKTIYLGFQVAQDRDETGVLIGFVEVEWTDKGR